MGYKNRRALFVFRSGKGEIARRSHGRQPAISHSHEQLQLVPACPDGGDQLVLALPCETEAEQHRNDVGDEEGQRQRKRRFYDRFQKGEGNDGRELEEFF